MLARIRTEPATAFIVSVLLGSALSVALYGSGKTSANNFPGVRQSGGSPSFVSSKAPAQAPDSQFGQTLASNPLGVLVSHDIDLRRDSRVVLDRAQPVVAKPLHSDRPSIAGTPAIVPAETSQPVQEKKAPARLAEQKRQIIARNSTQPQVLAASGQPQTPIVDDALQSAAVEAPASTPLSNAVFPDLAHVPVTSSSVVNSAGKPSASFIEVGSFKDETWAKSAAEKLTELGFHALVFHKALLWAQSYRVEVGPYTGPNEIETARRDLVLNGYKPHVVN